jgi:hypothetical protein
MISAAFAMVLLLQDPEKQVEELRRQLKDDAANVRVRAVRELTKLGARDAAADIRPLLKDSSWEVRYFSILALTQFEEKEAADDVRGLLADPEPTVITAAVAALYAWQIDAALDDLVPLLRHKSEDVRQTVLYHFALARYAKAAVQARELLRDSDRKVRLAAIHLLGVASAAEAVDDLLTLLAAGDAEFKAAALAALRTVGTAEKQGAAVKAMIANREAGPEAWELLGYWGDREALPWFAESPLKRPLWILNRFASPDAATKLRDWRVDRRDLRLSLTALFERCARGAGLKVEWEESIPEEKRKARLAPAAAEPLGRSPSAETVLAAGGYGWIIDGTSLRIVTPETAVKHWTKWLADNK